MRRILSVATLLLLALVPMLTAPVSADNSASTISVSASQNDDTIVVTAEAQQQVAGLRDADSASRFSWRDLDYWACMHPMTFREKTYFMPGAQRRYYCSMQRRGD